MRFERETAVDAFEEDLYFMSNDIQVKLSAIAKE